VLVEVASLTKDAEEVTVTHIYYLLDYKDSFVLTSKALKGAIAPELLEKSSVADRFF
jgi:hypothetical protein